MWSFYLSCHISIINNSVKTNISCPICRNNNILINTKPNYELNEFICNVSLFFSQLEQDVNNITKKIIDMEKSKFFTKSILYNNTDNNNNNNKVISQLNMTKKSYECPW